MGIINLDVNSCELIWYNWHKCIGKVLIKCYSEGKTSEVWITEPVWWMCSTELDKKTTPQLSVKTNEFCLHQLKKWSACEWFWRFHNSRPQLPFSRDPPHLFSVFLSSHLLIPFSLPPQPIIVILQLHYWIFICYKQPAPTNKEENRRGKWCSWQQRSVWYAW